ncbi:hypothetical protein JZU56_05430, partial [bacterium]|nr:hypothetical protein [bacterium]
GGGGGGGGAGPRKVQVLLDANRALRGVSVTRNGEGGGQSHGRGGASSAVGVGGGSVVVTNSAEAVHSRLRPLLADDDRGRSGVFLFPVSDERLRRILPSPLDEVAGVFHMKAYIVDDEMVLSGANLSEEYFDDRLDRYMLFANGGGGSWISTPNCATRCAGTRSGLARDACSESLQLAWEMALSTSKAHSENEALAISVTRVIRALKRLGKAYLLEKHYAPALECFLPSLELLRSSKEMESTLDCQASWVAWDSCI